jgi:hypothetical protein
MGYTTDFEGSFQIEPPLDSNQIAYLKAFSDTRRMKRAMILTKDRPDPVRESVGLPVGLDGEYFVGETGMCGQDRGSDIVKYNDPPLTQPGLWCQWVPSDDGARLEWNGAEKFYNYVEWLQYMIINFFALWGRTLSGTVSYQGEESSDFGEIRVVNNEVQVRNGKHVLGEWE